jgi:hypothetical protein
MNNEQLPSITEVMERADAERKKLNIFQKLSAITTELSTVAKNLEVGVGQNKYKAVGEADVLRAVKPLEAKYGVYSYPFSRQIIESGMIESTTYKGEVKKSLFERIETVYRFVNTEKPEEYIDITTYGDGIDSQDKSVGKAMTYADKYALLKAYKIITGEDPDQNASEDLNGADTQKKPSLDKVLLNKAKSLNIELENIAKYLKKDVKDLTNEDLQKCIDQKIKALAEKQAEVKE